MSRLSRGSFVLAVLFLGASLTASPVLAKCGKDCLKTLVTEVRACKAACAQGAAGKACRAACLAEYKMDKAACKAATNPTPPGCRETTTTTVPSGPRCPCWTLTHDPVPGDADCRNAPSSIVSTSPLPATCPAGASACRLDAFQTPSGFLVCECSGCDGSYEGLTVSSETLAICRADIANMCATSTTTTTTSTTLAGFRRPL